MQVVSASRRTDIPALYWRWFMKRLDAGYCHWINPFNAHQVFRVSLLPEDVAAIVFWTRNAAPMLRHVEALKERGFTFYVHYTINGYPEQLEHDSPAEGQAVAALRALSEAISPERVIWRYDPIIISSITPEAYHVERFTALAKRLRSVVSSVYFSFCDPYGRTQKHFVRLTREAGIAFEFGDSSTHSRLARRLAEIAGSMGLELYSCAEPGLSVEGVKRGSCIDASLLATLRPDLDFRLKPAPTREGCGCVQATDIGVFDTCLFGCEYCYANQSVNAPRKRHREHDPTDSLLWRPPSLRGVDLDESAAVHDQAPARIRARRPKDQLSMDLDADGF